MVDVLDELVLVLYSFSVLVTVQYQHQTAHNCVTNMFNVKNQYILSLSLCVIHTWRDYNAGAPPLRYQLFEALLHPLSITIMGGNCCWR